MALGVYVGFVGITIEDYWKCIRNGGVMLSFVSPCEASLRYHSEIPGHASVAFTEDTCSHIIDQMQ